MGIFHNRPLAAAECIAVLSLLFLWNLYAPIKLFVIGLIALAFLLLLFSRLWRTRPVGNRFLCAAIALPLCGMLLLSSFLFFDVRYAEAEQGIGEECTVEGTVLDRVMSTAYSAQLEVQLTERNGEPFSCRALIDTAYASSLQRGDRFSMTVTQRAFSYTESFEEEIYQIADGCLAAFVCDASEDCRILEGRDESFWVRMRDWQSFLSHRLRHAMGRDSGGLAAALLLGDRDSLSGIDRLEFRRAGVSHLLALSGLHVSILVGLLEWLLRGVRVPRQARAVLIPLAAVFYLFLTGCSPSTLRAVLMLCALYLALLLRERYDGFTVLCTVLFGILLVSPNALLDVSMWMSFVAAGSILIFLPILSEWIKERDHWSKPLKRLLRLCRGMICAVFVAVTVNMAMLFLTVFIYGEVALFAIPATLALSIPTTLLLILSLGVLALPTAPILSALASFCADGMLEIASFFSRIDGALLAVSDLIPRIFVVCFAIAILLFAVIRIEKRKYLWFCLPAGFVLVLAVAFAAVYLPSDEAEMIYINKSDGCICLFAKDGAAIAVDFSGGRYDKSYLLASSAREANCTELQDLIFTRYANLQPYVLQENATSIRIKNLHLPIPRDEWEYAMSKRMEQQASLYGIRVHYGFEEVCGEVAEITATDRAAGEGTDHLGQFCALLVNGRRVLLVNMAAMASPLNPLIDNLALSADVVTVLDDGLTTQNRTLIPRTREDALCVILEEERLLELLPSPIPDEILCVDVDKTRILLK